MLYKLDEKFSFKATPTIKRQLYNQRLHSIGKNSVTLNVKPVFMFLLY